MRILLQSLPLLAFTYIGSSIIVFLSLSRFLKADRELLPKLFICSLGTGPLLIAVSLWGLFSIAPFHDDSFYIFSVLALFSVLFLMSGPKSLKVLQELALIFREATLESCRWRNLSGLLLILGVIILASAQLIQSIDTPVYGSDESQYAFVSALGYERKTFCFYPLRSYDASTGYFDLSDHPPSFYFLKIWHYMIQGSADFAGISKFIEPVFSVYLAITVGFALLEYGLLTAGIGALLLLMIPGLNHSSIYHGIDTFRILPFFVTFFWITELLVRRTTKKLIVGGFFAGLSMVPHSIGGLLTLPIFFCLYGLLSAQSLRKRLLDISLLGSVALATGGVGYISNTLSGGAPVNAALPLFDQLKEFDYYRTRMLSQGIESNFDMLVKGVFKQFSNPQYYGYAGWAALAYCIWSHKTILNRRLEAVAFLVPAIFLFVIFLASCFREQRYVILALNQRYPLTTQPFLVLLAALCIHQAISTLSSGIEFLLQKAAVKKSIGTIWNCIKDSLTRIKSISSGLIRSRKKPAGEKLQQSTLISTGMSERGKGPINASLTPQQFIASILAIGCLALIFSQLKTVTEAIQRGNLSLFDSLTDRLNKDRTNAYYNIYNYVRANIPADCLTLVQSDAMFAYNLRRRLIGDVYPILADFYQSTSKEEGYSRLRDLHIDYLLMHTGWWPTVVSNSQMFRILADPTLVRLEYQIGHSFLYRLLAQPRPIQIVQTEHMSQNAKEWISLPDAYVWKPVISAGSEHGRSPLNLSAAVNFPALTCRDTDIFVITGEKRGKGQLQINALWSLAGDTGDNVLIWSNVSCKENDHQTFSSQFLIPKQASKIEIVFACDKNLSKTPIQISNIQLQRIQYSRLLTD